MPPGEGAPQLNDAVGEYFNGQPEYTQQPLLFPDTDDPLPVRQQELGLFPRPTQQDLAAPLRRPPGVAPVQQCDPKKMERNIRAWANNQEPTKDGTDVVNLTAGENIGYR